MSQPGEASARQNPRQVKILYTNWRGEQAIRTIVPAEGGLYFGANEWHPEPQWLLEALDVDKRQTRQFALSGIKAWFHGEGKGESSDRPG